MSGDKRFKLPFNYFGSKFGQLKWLIPILPPPEKGVNVHFAEIFGGSGVVTFNSAVK